MNNIFATYAMSGTTYYEVNQHRENCYGARQLTFIPNVPYTEEQLAEIARDDADMAAYAEYMGQDGPPEPEGWQYGFYKTEEAARRAVELHDSFAAMAEDCDAWGAPSECYRDATRGTEQELEKLDQEFGTYLNLPNPWLERGLEDRREPIGKTLFGDGWQNRRFDDHDVMQAMGERPAVRRVWPT